MRIVKIYSLVILLFTILVACEHSPQNNQHELSSRNLLHSKIMSKIEKYNVVFYKDFNLLTMTGIEEISIEKVSLPYVLVLRDSLNFPMEIGFRTYDNSRLYYNIKKQDNCYVDYSVYWKTYNVNIVFYLHNDQRIENFNYDCNSYMNNLNDFIDTSCILFFYKNSYIKGDTIIQKRYTFDCCSYDNPPFKERTTYGIFGDTTFSFSNTESSPELHSISYTKMYEQDGMFVMEKYNSSVNKKPKKTFYDKKHWISLTWLYAMKTY